VDVCFVGINDSGYVEFFAKITTGPKDKTGFELSNVELRGTSNLSELLTSLSAFSLYISNDLTTQ
jgi:hypothetical protein